MRKKRKRRREGDDAVGVVAERDFVTVRVVSERVDVTPVVRRASVSRVILRARMWMAEGWTPWD